MLARLALVAFEVLMLQQYVARGTAWHGLIHSLAGWGAGLAAGALVASVRGRATRGIGWAVAGQLVSAAPDVAYILANRPHRPWMDVFVGHIPVHTAWAPVLLTFGFFVAAGWAWWLASVGLPRAGAGLSLAATVVFGIALLRADPVPSQLIEFRAASSWAGAPTSALWCDPCAVVRPTRRGVTRGRVLVVHAHARRQWPAGCAAR